MAGPGDGTWVWIVVGLCGVVSTLAGLYAAELRRSRDSCCEERDKLRDAADRQLEAARARDAEELRLWREQQVRRTESSRP